MEQKLELQPGSSTHSNLLNTKSKTMILVENVDDNKKQSYDIFTADDPDYDVYTYLSNLMGPYEDSDDDEYAFLTKKKANRNS